MKMRTVGLLGIVSVMLGVGPLQAAVNDDLRNDAASIAGWFSEEIADITAFSAGGSLQGPADVRGLLGVEGGLSLGLTSTKLGVDQFHSLPFTRLNGAVTDIPASVITPLALIHAKVGLPGGFDLGLKFGGLNNKETEGDSESEYENHVLGVEARKRLLGGGLTGVALPDLALSVGYDQASGEVTRTERYNALITGGSTLNAATTWKSEWDTGAVTARVVASKTVLIVTPYVGVGYTKLMGDATTTVSIVGADSLAGAINETAQVKKKAEDDFVQLTGGAELTIFPLVKLNLGGLYAKDRWAATLGFRASFR